MRLFFEPHQPLHPPPLILQLIMGGLQGCLAHLQRGGLQRRLEHSWRPWNPTAKTWAMTSIAKGNTKGHFIAMVILNPTSLFTHAPLTPPSTSQALTSHPSPLVAVAIRPPSTQRVSAQCNFQSLSSPFSTTLRRTPPHSHLTSFGLAQVSLLPILAQRIT
jgi:hypothetical protein